MPYPLRSAPAESVHHVAARGNNREPIFREDDDLRRYQALLREYKERFQFELLAYVLMTNHIHLLLRPSESGTLSQIMQCLTIRYTKYFNQRYSRVGHVFQGRFFSRVVTNEADLLVVSRYIHLNPVRAKMVSDPTRYPWSSYGAYAEPPVRTAGMVDSGLVLELVAPNSREPRQAYRQFVETPARDEIRQREADLHLSAGI